MCSRRDAERWILAGRVAVGGKVLTSAAFNVTKQDHITVDGQPIPQEESARKFFIGARGFRGQTTPPV